MQTAKTLTIEGITLTEDTVEIFEDLQEKTLERLESIELGICSSGANAESCAAIAEVIAKFQTLKTMKIQVWRESNVTPFFQSLNTHTDSAFYKTVTHLEIIIHEDVINFEDEGFVKQETEIETFIGKFQNLASLNSYPRDGFNPYKNVNVETLEELIVYTPCTPNDMKIVSSFVSSSN